MDNENLSHDSKVDGADKKRVAEHNDKVVSERYKPSTKPTTKSPKAKGRTKAQVKHHLTKLSKLIKKHKLVSIIILLILVVGIGIDVYYVATNSTKVALNTNNNQVIAEYNNKLPDLKKAVEKNPNDAASRKNYGVALYVTGDYEAAKTQYEAAVKLDSKDAITYNNLGNTYRDLKNYGKAKEAYEKAFEINPKLVNAYVNLANVQLYILKNSDDAITTYKKALKALPNNDQIELLLGIAYENANKTTEAKQTYQDILARSPNNQAAKNNLDRLNKK